MKNLLIITLAIMIGTALTIATPAEKETLILEVLTLENSTPSEMQLKALEEMEEPDNINLKIRVYDARAYADAEPELEIKTAPCMIIRTENGAIIGIHTGYMNAEMVTNWITIK